VSTWGRRKHDLREGVPSIRGGRAGSGTKDTGTWTERKTPTYSVALHVLRRHPRDVPLPEVLVSFRRGSSSGDFVEAVLDLGCCPMRRDLAQPLDARVFVLVVATPHAAPGRGVGKSSRSESATVVRAPACIRQ
jgi:hypothetical protein